MLHFLKRILPREPLPPHIHFHLDQNGDEIWCDDSVCRPQPRPALYFPPRY